MGLKRHGVATCGRTRFCERFVSGHDFSYAASRWKYLPGFSPGLEARTGL